MNWLMVASIFQLSHNKSILPSLVWTIEWPWSCGANIHCIVKCSEILQESAVLDCYCMTCNELTETVVGGACPYNCVMSRPLIYVFYRPMPKTVEQLNDAMCCPFFNLDTSAVSSKCAIALLCFRVHVQCAFGLVRTLSYFRLDTLHSVCTLREPIYIYREKFG